MPNCLVVEPGMAIPLEKTYWVDKGVVKNLSCTLALLGRKKGVKPGQNGVVVVGDGGLELRPDRSIFNITVMVYPHGRSSKPYC